MKKFFGIVLCMLFAFSLAACNDSVDPDKTAVNAAKTALTIENTTAVTSDFDVTTTGAGNVLISWVSSNPAVASVSAAGKVTITRPVFTAGNAALTLTATLTKGAITDTKVFNITVLKADEVIIDTTKTVANAIAKPAGTIVTIVGVVSGFVYTASATAMSKSGIYLTDKTGTIYIFGTNTAASVSIGNEISISAERSDYLANGITSIQAKNPTNLQIISQSKEIDWTAVVKGKTFEELTDLSETAKAAETSTTVYEVTLTMNYYTTDTYHTLSLIKGTDTTKRLNIYIAGNVTLSTPMDAFANLKAVENTVITAYYIKNGTNSAGTAWRGTILRVVS